MQIAGTYLTALTIGFVLFDASRQFEGYLLAFIPVKRRSSASKRFFGARLSA
jgi:hypothetical protein